MFCQSQAYPSENKPEKRQIFLAFLLKKKNNGAKKSRISKSGIKNPNWQRCYTRIENARKVRKKTQFFVMYTSPEIFFFFSPAETL